MNFTRRIKKQKKEKYLTQYMDDNGYLYVNLVNNKGERKKEYVHELVAKSFVPNPNNWTVVRHKDGNKLNNRADNLEWVET